MLLIDPSFQIASLEFAVDAVRTPIGQTADGASPNEASANATADKGLNPQRTNTDMSIIKFRLQDCKLFHYLFVGIEVFLTFNLLMCFRHSLVRHCFPSELLQIEAI